MKIHLYFHLSDLIKQKREREREKRERNNKMWD